MSGAANIVSAVGTALGSVMGMVNKPKAPKVEKAPVLAKPTVAPVEDSAAIAEARKKSIIQRQMSSGRASTMLSDKSDTFG